MNITTGFIRWVFVVGIVLAAGMLGTTSNAHASESCKTAKSVAGPFLIQRRAFNRAMQRLPSAVQRTEQQMRRALDANGFRAASVRYGRVGHRCFRPNPQQFRKKCEAYRTVCMRAAPFHRCNDPKQYYSTSAGRCVTLH